MPCHLAAKGVRHTLMSEEVLQIPIAVKAGLGELGRNNSLITQKFGPRLRLSTVTTDLPLAVDPPVRIGVQEYCDSATSARSTVRPSASPTAKSRNRRWSGCAARPIAGRIAARSWMTT